MFSSIGFGAVHAEQRLIVMRAVEEVGMRDDESAVVVELRRIPLPYESLGSEQRQRHLADRQWRRTRSPLLVRKGNCERR